MNIKNIIRKTRILALFILINSLFLSFALPLYCQENKEEKKETKRLTREAQMAMVESQRSLETNDFTSARKPILDFMALEKAKEEYTPQSIPEQMFIMLAFCWYNDGKLEEAINVYAEAHKTYPENSDILTHYSVMLYEGEEFLKAAPMLERVYEEREEKEIRYLNYASQAYYLGEKLEDAKRVKKRMIEISENPESPWFDFLISICFDQEKMDEAEGYIYQALDLFPMDIKYWKWLGNIRIEKEDYVGLVSAYEIGYTVETPKTKKDWKNLIDLYRSMNATSRVVKSFRGSLKNENVTEEDHLLIANSYAKMMKIDEAVSYLDGVITKNPSSNLMLEKGRILYQARRNKEAIKAFDELIAFDPEVGEAYMMKGNAAWDLKDWDTAKKAYRKGRNFKDHRPQAKNLIDFIESIEEAKNKIEYPAYYHP
ncbi:tetratricopeptide repeat protein [Thermodesulfobacteriota bacterium]